MLSRSQRVSGRMFDDVLEKGRVFHSPLFLARVLKDTSIGKSRVAVVAPVKIAKTSVLRHNIRRRAYNAVRPFMPKIAAGHIVLLFAKQPVIEAPFAALQAAVSDIFVKAGVLR